MVSRKTQFDYAEQSGFRQQRKIQKMKRMNTLGKCIALCIDINRAYDNEWHDYTIKKLYSWNIQGNCLFFVKNFLTEIDLLK